MFNWSERIRRAYADGFDEGAKNGVANFAWFIRKSFERKEREAGSTPNLYTLEEILEVVDKWSKY